MTTLHLYTKQRRFYKVDLKTGNIYYDGLRPSGDWKFVAFRHVKRNCWIRLSEIQKDPEMIKSIPFTWKNGNPQWTVRDLDHGTTREWGDGIISASITEDK